VFDAVDDQGRHQLRRRRRLDPALKSGERVATKFFPVTPAAGGLALNDDLIAASHRDAGAS